jgi:hypothetical protein
MAGVTADVTVHIDQTLNHGKLQGIAELVRKGTGVVSADFHDDRPHFLLVRYDPGRTTAQAVHGLVTGQGVHAELIGM